MTVAKARGERCTWRVTVGTFEYETTAASKERAISNIRFREFGGYFPRMACVDAVRA